MSKQSYDIGDSTRFTATFTNAAGAVADPVTVTFKLRRPPEGGITTYVHGTDVELVKDSTGVYHVDLIHAEAGEYCYRWAGSGTLDTAGERHFIVNKSCFS